MRRIKDFFGRTVGEFSAAYSGNFNALFYFLKKVSHEDATISGAEKMAGHTSAHFACYGGSHPSILYLLEQHGVNIFKKDDFGCQPLHVAANAAKIEVLRFLLTRHKEARQSTTLTDNRGRTTLHAIFCLGSSVSEKANDTEMAESLKLLLAEYGTDYEAALNTPDISGFTPIDLALAAGYLQDQNGTETKVCQLLKTLDVDLRGSLLNRPILYQDYDFFQRTKLMGYAFSGDKDTTTAVKNVQEQLNEGADPNFANPAFGGRNSIHLACCGGNPPDILKALMLNPNANLMAVDSQSDNALHYAANTGSLELLDALLKGQSAMFSIGEGVEDFNKFDIKHINDQDVWGRTLGHTAAMDCVRNKTTRSAVIKRLYTEGLDFSKTDLDGNTAYDMAKIRGNTVVIDAIEELFPSVKSVPIDDNKSKLIIFSHVFTNSSKQTENTTAIERPKTSFTKYEL